MSAAPAPRRAEVDPARPVLAQVRALGSGYADWVLRPLPPRTPPLRLFASDALEGLTYTPWWVVPALWLPVAAGLAAAAWHQGVGPRALAAWAAVGAAAWTAVEYALHRWLFHLHPRGPRTQVLHFLFHGIHHVHPWDARRLVFPPVPAALLAGAIHGAAALGLGLPASLAFMAGLLPGYVAYDVLHFRAHHRRPRGRLARALRDHHLAHHFRDPGARYGVSQPVWDHLLGTQPRGYAARGGRPSASAR